MIDGNPTILVECKPCNDSLDKYTSQLFRYFISTNAKFEILTNGVIYQFYTDLDNKNKMDETPFLTLDLLNLKERDISEIKKFTKDTIDIDSIFSSASDLKYSRLIKTWFSSEIENPSADFVKYILNKIYDGSKGQKVVDRFIPLVKKSISQHINDSMNIKIKAALKNEETEDGLMQNTSSENEITETSPTESSESKIVTTLEELEAFAIVKSILRDHVDVNRIKYTDWESYFAVLLDGSTWNRVCRIHILPTVKYLTVPGENKKPVRLGIDSIDDIYKHDKAIIESCMKYINK